MAEKIQLAFPVVVEGKYDKIKLTSILDGLVITTSGFGIFDDSEKAMLIRTLAEKTPIIVLTDSDHAGNMIRGHIASMIPKERLIQLYVPQVRGKEKRKVAPSAEGFLGVEGIEADTLRSILKPYSVTVASSGYRYSEIRNCDLYELGLTGQADSTVLRDRVAESFGLPHGMTMNAFRSAISLLADIETVRRMTAEIKAEI